MNEPSNNHDTQNDYAAFIAIDWADRQHVFSLQVAGQTTKETGTLEQKPEVIGPWVAKLRERFGGRPVAIAVEQSRGALIHALLTYDFIVHDEVISQQSVNQSSARLLHRDRHGPAPEALAEFGHPGADDFGLLFQRTGFFCGLPSHLQAEDMLAVGPIDGDEGRVVVLRVVVVGWFVHRFLKNTLADPGEGLIVRPAYRSGPPLSIR